MRHGRFTGGRRAGVLACAVLLLGAGVSPGETRTEDLRSILAAQAKELAALKQEINAQEAPQQAPQQAPKLPYVLDDDSVKKIVNNYLQENPGAGMPSGVQTGYKWGSGFSIASAPDPKYTNWDDDSKIPFELRFRGRIQLSYMNYKVTDRTNHVTNTPAVANANAVRLADFSQLEVKRMNFIFEGTVFDPNLRYHFEFLGSTRGLPGVQNNKVIQTAGNFDPNTSPTTFTTAAGTQAATTGGGILLDHAVTLFEGWVAYDFHPCWGSKGCAPACCDGTYRYVPTVSLIFGKMKPFFGLDEFMKNSNMQFVDFSMADTYFSADDDTRLMAAGVEVKAADDRFFLQAILTNGSEGTLQPNNQMDNLPGFIAGFWYDLGGTWNQEKKKWDLYGVGFSDVEYHCDPVLRVGGCTNLVPMNRRSLYGDNEESRWFVMPAGPGGTRLINVLNGDAGTPLGSHAVDAFDAYEFNAFWAAKYRGFSVANEWWFRDLNNFRTTPNGRGDIIYQDTLGPGGATANALFPHHALIDYGTTLQAGYFLIPKKLEVAARWSSVWGASGDINGNGTFTTRTIPGFAAPVHVVNGAFRQFHNANEYTLGVNYFFKGHLLKWQTDVGVYDGGNPAAGGVPVTGVIAGSDGFLFRTQFQMFF